MCKLKKWFNFVVKGGQGTDVGDTVNDFCKRLPSHTGQEQACSRITWLFVRLFVTMPKMAQYTGIWMLTAP